MLKEMQEAGLKPHPAAHQAALSAVATTEGHEAAMALLATMKVRRTHNSTQESSRRSVSTSNIRRRRALARTDMIWVPVLYGGYTTLVCDRITVVFMVLKGLHRADVLAPTCCVPDRTLKVECVLTHLYYRTDKFIAQACSRRSCI